MPRKKGGRKNKNKNKNKNKVAKDTQIKQEELNLKQQGDAAFRKKDYDAAIHLYTNAIEEEMKSEEQDNEKLGSLHSNRSAAYHAIRDFEAALQNADETINFRPNWARGYYRRGRSLEGLELFEEAIAAHRQAHQIEDTEQYRRGISDCPYNLMIEWLLNGGSLFPKLYLRYYDEDYRGVHCSTNIPAGEIVTQIPLQFIMTSEIAKESDIGTKIQQSGIHLTSQHSWLACYLMQEKSRGQSRWDPYLRCLPQKYSNMPINFTDDEKAYLVGSFSLDKMQARMDSLAAEYAAICDGVPEFADMATYEDFVWARHVVITRIFGMVIEGNKKTNGLVPMADMLNHKRPRETKWTFDKTRQSFTITSLKELHIGDQAFDSYGRKCNHRFFVNYGFSLEVNEDNEVVLRYNFDEEDPIYDIKTRLLGREERKYQIPANTEHEKTLEMFSFVRLLVTQKNDIRVFSNFKSLNVEKVQPISIENEMAMLEEVRESALRCLSRFETTLEEDEKFYEENKGSLDFNIRNCILMRRGEKRVCHYFLKLAETALPLFSKSPEEINNVLRKLKKKAKKGSANFEPYVSQIVLPLVEAGT